MDSVQVISKVAIIGNGESRFEAPYSDKDMEIWVTSSVRDVPRYNVIFELHGGYTDDEEGKARRDFIKNAICPVLMQKEHKNIKNSVEYPLDRIMEKWGGYFTNSISYMIAYAMLDGYNEIHLYGVSMEHDMEYGKQRASCEYWIGLARGLGIKVVIAKSSDLCKAYYLYGYEEHPMIDKAKEKKQLVTQKLNELRQKHEYYKKMLHKHEGYEEALNYFLNYFE